VTDFCYDIECATREFDLNSTSKANYSGDDVHKKAKSAYFLIITSKL